MTLVSNDPSWWALIDLNRFYNYFVVASCAAIVYDWVLAFAQEVELVWMRPWSFVTFLYFSVRYIGMLYTVIYLGYSFPSASLTDAGCKNIYTATNWMSLVVSTLLAVIMITRLHAMYQGSRKMLIFLILVFLPIAIACPVILQLSQTTGEKLVLSGTYQCAIGGSNIILVSDTWILGTVWELVALSLAIWIAIQHFRQLQRPWTAWTIDDCMMMLIKSHLLYFASFFAVSVFYFGYYSPKILDSSSTGSYTYAGVLHILANLRIVVMGPRLILSVREHHTKQVAGSISGTGTGVTTIAFQAQECVYVSTGGGV